MWHALSYRLTETPHTEKERQKKKKEKKGAKT